MTAGGPAVTLQALQQLRHQHEVQLHVSQQQQHLRQLPTAQAAGPGAAPRCLALPLSVGKGPGATHVDPAAPAAGGLQQLQALNAITSVAVSAGEVVGRQGSLCSAGSGGSPVSAGSSGTAAGPVAVTGGVTPSGDVLAAAAGAAGMLGVLQVQTVVQ
jgi:hypothetical protein